MQGSGRTGSLPGRALSLFFLCCWLFCPLALAAPLEHFVYLQPKVLEQDDFFSLFLPLSVNNEDALGDLLRDGATLELTVEIEVDRRRTLWFNQGIFSARYIYVFKHDTLTRLFRL